MTDTSAVPATESEWLAGVAALSARYGAEPLIAMLGSVTSDLTAEARGAALDIAKTYVANQAELRSAPVLRIADSPLAAD